jgi:succinate-semialdehyde dehydrogenase/glutarate-semialdehyde dehydrogenase
LSGSRVKRLSLELGGHAPFIVFPSAVDTSRNVEKAVEMLMLAKFRNAGQTCISPNRVYVHADIHDHFVTLLQERVQSLTVGDGFERNTQIGPLIHVDAAVKVQRHVDDAVAQGATIVCGGTILSEHGPNYYAPTILIKCNQNMLLAREETFGPVVPVFKFASEDEAVRMANDTDFGLASYVYTTDMAQSWRVSERLDYGMVGVNEGLISYDVAPFGGVKQSGFGREGSYCGMDDYTHIKYICIRHE